MDRFQLLPHPEGGYYRETYRAELQIPGSELGTIRAVSTGIYFMLTAGNFSALHRIKSDEMWHFYGGDAIEIVELTPDGTWINTRLGKDIASGEVPQYVVKAGHWFGSCVANNAPFGLVGCTVAPGFDFADFELADRAELQQAFPAHASAIETWTR
ncbi:MAG: cupin domain-containing protein [Chitinophagaceae bacterium]|nr:cupin domain-containing protein [Chitinophagaceae bacterium]